MQLFDIGLVIAALKIIVASIAMGAFSYILLYALQPLLNTHTVLGLFLQAAIAGSGGALVFFTVSYYLGLHEAQYAINTIKNFRHTTMRFLSGG